VIHFTVSFVQITLSHSPLMKSQNIAFFDPNELKMMNNGFLSSMENIFF
jgi:hypothetical protein